MNTLSEEDLRALEEILDRVLKPINDKLETIDSRLKKIIDNQSQPQ